MKIGDEVYIHGYIDEIRKDTVIIKNEGGYFGTAPSEIKTIAQEPQTEGDCISREAVLEKIYNIDELEGLENSNIFAKHYADMVKGMPSVTPQELKVGHWKITNDGAYSESAYICECSECGETIWVFKDAARRWRYCPNCGAKMESEGTR